MKGEIVQLWRTRCEQEDGTSATLVEEESHRTRVDTAVDSKAPQNNQGDEVDPRDQPWALGLPEVIPPRFARIGLAACVLGSGVVPVVAFAFWAEGPSWVLMWSVILTLFFAAKVVMWQAFAPKGASVSTFLRYSLTWPGMSPRPFTRPGLALEFTTTEEWLLAAVKTLLGVVLVWGVTRLAIHHNHLLGGYIGMVGLFVLLGFGVPHLASMFWRRLGVNAEPIMHNPLLARSLADFWGRRWNRAFRDVVCPLFCHPLVPMLGHGGALIIGFLVSGIVHELVISFPSRGGFGVLIQRRLNTLHFVRHRVILTRISTFAFLTAPLPFLYPPLFVDRVVLPFLRVIGAT